MQSLLILLMRFISNTLLEGEVAYEVTLKIHSPFTFLRKIPPTLGQEPASYLPLLK